MFKRMFECDDNGTPRLIYESLRVGIQPANVSGSDAAGNPSGTVTSAAASCAGAGSNGVYTYSWVCSGCTATSPNSASTTFYATVDAGATNNASAYCEISDGVNSVDTDTIAVALTNTTPAFTGQIDTYNAAGTYVSTIPDGATTMLIEVWGNSGDGGAAYPAYHTYGGGGGSGGYARSSFDVSSANGQTVNISITAANALSNTTVTSGTFGMTEMVGPYGEPGSNATSSSGGTGGFAGQIGTGGNVTNSAGNPGTDATASGAGVGGAGIVGINGTGSNGGPGSITTALIPGGPGLVIIQYSA